MHVFDAIPALLLLLSPFFLSLRWLRVDSKHLFSLLLPFVLKGNSDRAMKDSWV